MNGLVSQLLHIRIQFWIAGNITTVNLLLRFITVHTYRCEIPSADQRQGKPVKITGDRQSGRRSRGPTVLQVCVNKCPTRRNHTQFILSVNRSTYFGWSLRPSPGAQITVSTASGTGQPLLLLSLQWRS